MKKIFIVPFVVISLIALASCSNNSGSVKQEAKISTVTTTSMGSTAHDDSGLAPHGHEGAIVDDHHKGEINVAPHNDEVNVAHDDSGLPPHRD